MFDMNFSKLRTTLDVIVTEMKQGTFCLRNFFALFQVEWIVSLEIADTPPDCNMRLVVITITTIATLQKRFTI